MIGLLCGLCVNNVENAVFLQIVCLHMFISNRQTGISVHNKINNECTHILHTSYSCALYISSWAWRTTVRHITSRRLACFRNNVHKMSKPNCSFIRLLLRTSGTRTVRDEDPLFLSFTFFPSDTESVQSLLLRRFGIKSRTKTQHILTANHHSDADIFLKEQKGHGEEWQCRCCGRLLSCVSPPLLLAAG